MIACPTPTNSQVTVTKPWEVPFSHQNRIVLPTASHSEHFWGLQTSLFILDCHSVIPWSISSCHTSSERGLKYLTYDLKFNNIYWENKNFPTPILLKNQLTGTPLSRRLCHSSERWRRADHRSLRCCTSFRMLRFIFEDTWSPFPFFSLFSSPSISPPRETIQVNHISSISHHISEIFYCTNVLNVCISSPERNPIWAVLSHF